MSGALPFLISPVLAGANALFGKKPAKAPAPTVVPTRNAAAEEAQRRDLVSKRRGVAANMILGASGAESATGSKTQLGL